MEYYNNFIITIFREQDKADGKTSAASPPLQPWVEQTRFRKNLFENQ